MQAQGKDDEETARRSANRWQTFWRVTLPNIPLGPAVGVLRATPGPWASSGAVSVVSGHISRRDQYHAPARRDSLQRVQLTAAFAVASLLALLRCDAGG